VDVREFEVWEVLILTGQMAAEEVPEFLRRHPAFEAWFNERLALRRPSSPTPLEALSRRIADEANSRPMTEDEAEKISKRST
jgi:hypothetical protein